MTFSLVNRAFLRPFFRNDMACRRRRAGVAVSLSQEQDGGSQGRACIYVHQGQALFRVVKRTKLASQKLLLRIKAKPCVYRPVRLIKHVINHAGDHRGAERNQHQIATGDAPFVAGIVRQFAQHRRRHRFWRCPAAAVCRAGFSQCRAAAPNSRSARAIPPAGVHRGNRD